MSKNTPKIKTLQDAVYNLLSTHKYSIDDTFSEGKTLWYFQTEALRHGASLLKYYYEDKSADEDTRRNKLISLYRSSSIDTSRLNNDTKIGKNNRAIIEYARSLDMGLFEDGTGTDNIKVPFDRICNRMGFWMATGSGKTLVIVKLIELLARMMDEELIPRKEILFLSHKDHLLEQLRSHVAEYNSHKPYRQIVLESLRDLNRIRYQQSLLSDTCIRVFVSKPQLLKMEEREQTLDFRLYDNRGNWYLILDEAHRGDSSDSIPKMIFNIMSRNGFLFNFSATFTEHIDHVTTIYNFNLAEFVSRGYGKHIIQMQEDTSAFSKNPDKGSKGKSKEVQDGSEEYSEQEKRRIALKSLVLLAYIKKCWQELNGFPPYHSPMLVIFGHTVAEEDSDLQMFFDELKELGAGKVSKSLFERVKLELCEELRKASYQFEGNATDMDLSLLQAMTMKDIYRYVFNASGPGTIEVVLPKDDISDELAFQLNTGTEPFACIKISAVREWLSQKLKGFPVSKMFLRESYFSSINDPSSPINILLGAFSFYEGWDSNRPNVILYVNIGTNDAAHKFVMQSMGRGVRVSPAPEMMGRIERHHNDSNAMQIASNKRRIISPLETLFVFSASRRNLDTIIDTMESFSSRTVWKPLPSRRQHTGKNVRHLFIPSYRHEDKPIVEHITARKFVMREGDLSRLDRFMSYISRSDRILWAYCNYDPKDISLLHRFIENHQDYFSEDKRTGGYRDVRDMLLSIKRHISQRIRDFDKPKKLEDEIIHYRHIQVSAEQYDAVKSNHDEVRRAALLHHAIDRRKYGVVNKLLAQGQPDPNVSGPGSLSMKYLREHYYYPVIHSDQKLDWIRHIIAGSSEHSFIEDLANSKLKHDHDWWMFSRIDEHLDRVYIPYYDREVHQMREFYPDFIFWFGKGDEVTVVFVDPKGATHSDYEYKVDGYRILFEDENGQPKTFVDPETGIKVRFLLKLYTKDVNLISEGYRKYWIDNPSNIPKYP